VTRPALILALVFAAAVAAAAPPASTFTIAVVPDTQNYLDYRHQRAEGFPFDASALFLEQMSYVSSRLVANGGDVAFVVALGDVWQSRVTATDELRAKAGVDGPPGRGLQLGVNPNVAAVEIPIAQRGYALLAGHVPFGVVPGNHDYDWSWPNGQQPRVGGLQNFVAVFGEHSAFFKDQPWYVGAHDGGGDSAQLFTAGGYRFLHIGLQYDPSDDSLAWASSLIARYPGVPTLVTTHRFLDNSGERPAEPRALPDAKVEYRSPADVWQRFIREHDQIFLVLSGHFSAQGFRVDDNRFGHHVYQVLADFQGRQQTAKDAGRTLSGVGEGIGDGWTRLMTFDLARREPEIRVRTYSTYYKAFSTDMPHYSDWYKAHEKPALTEREFLAADDFTVRLTDFRRRFGRGKH